MEAIETLLPVFIMMLIGYISKKRNWLTREQNDGAKRIVFNILFPFLIFNIIASSKLSGNLPTQILFLDIAWILIYFAGRKLTGFTGRRFERISPYLLMTCEGGNVALPLYITLVGSTYAVNIVTFDIAGILINFGIVPILISHQVSGTADIKSLIKQIFSSSFLIAVISGVAINLTGLYRVLIATEFGNLYQNIITTVTSPIMGIILFTLGYELRIDLSMIGPLFKLALMRLTGCFFIIGGFYLLFPNLMNNEIFRIAVFLYFMCPTGFPVPLQVQPLVKNEEDNNFMSAFLSLFMVSALAVYTLLTVLFI
ncbi:MAG: AEC family transporter [Anaerovoracaceae bacterium]